MLNRFLKHTSRYSHSSLKQFTHTKLLLSTTLYSFSRLSLSTMSDIPKPSEKSGNKRKNYPRNEHWRHYKKNKKTDASVTPAAAEGEEGTATAVDAKKLSAAEAYEAGLNQVAPPANDRVLTPEAGLDAVTPYRNMPYLKQIRRKRGDVIKSLKRIYRELNNQYFKHNREVRKMVESGQMKGPIVQQKPYLPYASDRTQNQIPCPLGHVIESPVLKGYRNKNEFTLGLDMDGKPIAGFQCGRYADGESRIGSPAGCLSAPDCALEVAELITQFMQTHPIGSKYPTWNKANHSGFYRIVCVRNSTALGQMMVSLQVNPKAIDNAEEYEAWKAAFKEYMLQHTSVNDVSLLTKHHEYNTRDTILSPEKLVLPTGVTSDNSFYTRTQHALTCLLVQEYEGMSNSAPDTCVVHTLYGNDCIFDVISKKVFRVNLNSFFQVNVKGAEILYNKAACWALAKPHDFKMPTPAVLQTYKPMEPDHKERLQVLVEEFRAYQQAQAAKAGIVNADADADVKEGDEGSSTVTKDTSAKDEGSASPINLDKDDDPATIDQLEIAHDYPVVPLSDIPNAENKDKTLLLDICCGTGTIGLIMSDYINKSVGLEIVPAAIEDAKVNAKLNNIENADFVCGKAEATIRAVLSKYDKELDYAVGIVDPPRGGLHNDVIMALRASKLKKIVYVSCNATTLADNVVRLAGPTTRKYINAPFVPVCAIAVDMFPHTQHCEVVMLLEREHVEAAPPEVVEEEVAEAEKKEEQATESTTTTETTETSA